MFQKIHDSRTNEVCANICNVKTDDRETNSNIKRNKEKYKEKTRIIGRFYVGLYRENKQK